MSVELNRHLLPIVDSMVDNCLEELGENQKISCRKGCDYCCHLLVEISWEEALELAGYVRELAPEQQESLKMRIRKNAEKGRGLFRATPETENFCEPYGGDKDIPEDIYDSYFYKMRTPCPFLTEGACSAYEHRPVSCRLHMVTSEPEICGFDVEDESDYNVPEEVEELKENLAPILQVVQKDPRWGLLSIMVERAVEHLEQQETENKEFLSVA